MMRGVGGVRNENTRVNWPKGLKLRKNQAITLAKYLEILEYSYKFGLILDYFSKMTYH